MIEQPERAYVWSASTIQWQDTDEDGTKYALLEGERNVAGEVFTYAFFIPAGFWDAPHWHTSDARIMVLQGTLYLGYGETHTDEALKALPAGTVALVPANAPHFDGAYEDTIIIGTATGPWSTHYVGGSSKVSAGTV